MGKKLEKESFCLDEWLCTRILKRFGIKTVQSYVAHFKDTHVLIVERFDRWLSENGEWIVSEDPTV